MFSIKKSLSHIPKYAQPLSRLSLLFFGEKEQGSLVTYGGILRPSHTEGRDGVLISGPF